MFFIHILIQINYARNEGKFLLKVPLLVSRMNILEKEKKRKKAGKIEK